MTERQLWVYVLCEHTPISDLIIFKNELPSLSLWWNGLKNVASVSAEGWPDFTYRRNGQAFCYRQDGDGELIPVNVINEEAPAENETWIVTNREINLTGGPQSVDLAIIAFIAAE